MPFARKFAQQKIAFLYLIGTLLLLFSCGRHVFDDPSGNVTFYNESSYSVSVYQKSFDGATLVDMLASGDSYSTIVNPSDNYGAGSVFSVKYWFWIGENVWTSGIDPNGQIQHNIEAGKSYDIQISNASNIKWEESFVKIQNASNMPLEFNYLSTYYKQVGNGELAVPSGKIGIYKISGEIKDHTITQVYEQYPFPDFVAEKGRIYNFIFDGKSVKQTWEQGI
jgi:hypothetical protein